MGSDGTLPVAGADWSSDEFRRVYLRASDLRGKEGLEGLSVAEHIELALSIAGAAPRN